MVNIKDIDLSAHKTCIFGIQGSGKTHWARTVYKQFKKPIVFQVNEDDDWEKEKQMYVWKVKRTNLTKDGLQKEIDMFVDHSHKWAEAGKVDLIIFDEADLFFKSNYDLDFKMNDLVLNHRHIPKKRGTALWFATRRPQDIPTKIVESSKHLIIFKLEGLNAINRFREIDPRIPPLIEKLGKNEFVYKEIGQPPEVCKPLK